MADKTRERAIGDRGEGAACELLKKKGCRILETNYSSSGGEIDIIARQGEYIIFAEVKTREASAFGTLITEIVQSASLATWKSIIFE